MKIKRNQAMVAEARRQKAAAGFATALYEGLLKRRQELAGQPTPPEIAERLQRVVSRMRSYGQMRPSLTQEETRFMFAILLAYEFWPETIPAIEAALAPCTEIVDEAVVSFDVSGRVIDQQLLAELWNKICEIAGRKQFQKWQAEARERLAKRVVPNE